MASTLFKIKAIFINAHSLTKSQLHAEKSTIADCPIGRMRNNYSQGENNNGTKAIFHKFNFEAQKMQNSIRCVLHIYFNLHKMRSLFNLLLSRCSHTMGTYREFHGIRCTEDYGAMDTWRVIKWNDNMILNLLHIKWQFLFGCLSLNGWNPEICFP